MAKLYGDLETWLLDEGDRLYRYQAYDSINRSETNSSEPNGYRLCRIEEAIDCGDDWLLGLREVENDVIYYFKLNEIHLALFDKDKISNN